MLSLVSGPCQPLFMFKGGLVVKICSCGRKKCPTAQNCKRCSVERQRKAAKKRLEQLASLGVSTVCPNCKHPKSLAAFKCKKCNLSSLRNRLDIGRPAWEDIVEVYLQGGATLEFLAKMRGTTKENVRQHLVRLRRRGSLDFVLGVDVSCRKQDRQKGLIFFVTLVHR